MLGLQTSEVLLSASYDSEGPGMGCQLGQDALRFRVTGN